MYKAFHDHVVRMATPEMTAELEHDMDLIADGKTSKYEVIQISRDMLHQTYDDLFERREDLAKTIWAGMDEDKYIGTCEVCEAKGRTVHEDGSPNRLRIIDLKGGKRFWGCEGYNRDDPEDPDSCGNSGPLPGRGYELWRLEPKCSICGVRPRLTVKGFRGRPWKLCLNDDCPTMVEMREKRAERQKAKEEAEKRKAEKEAAEGKDDDDSRQFRRQEARARPRATGPLGRAQEAAELRRRGPSAPRARRRPAAGSSARGAAPSASAASGRAAELQGVRQLRGHRRRRQEHAGADARRALGQDTVLLREPGGTPPASGSASCSRTRSWSWPRGPSCCSSSPRAPSSSRP